MDLEHLLLERELHLVLCRYARACDQRSWRDLEDVFAEHATANYGDIFHLDGRAAIIASIRSHLGGCGPSQHLLGDLVVERRGDEVYSRVYVRAAHQGAGEKAALTYETFAEYQDRWARTPAGWRIAHRYMKVNYEVGSRGILGPGPEGN